MSWQEPTDSAGDVQRSVTDRSKHSTDTPPKPGTERRPPDVDGQNADPFVAPQTRPWGPSVQRYRRSAALVALYYDFVLGVSQTC